MHTVRAAMSHASGDSVRLAFRLNIFGVGLAALWTTVNSVLLPERVSDVVSPGMQGTGLGVISLIGIGSAAVIQPLAGYVSDHSTLHDRRRPYIVGGAVIVALGIAGFGWAGSFAILLLAYLVMQLAANVSQAAFQALIPDLVPSQERGLAAGVKNGLNVVGTGVGLLATQLILTMTGSVGLALAFLAVILIVCAGLVMIWVPPVRPTRGEHRPSDASIGGHISELVTSSRLAFQHNHLFRNAVVAQFLFLLGIYSLQRFLLYFLKERYGLENAAIDAGGYLAGAILLGIIAAPVAGLLSDHIGRVWILRWAVVIGVIGLLGVALAPSIGLAAVAGVLVAISTGSFMAVNWALISEGIPTGKGAQYFALANIATAGASALAGLFGPLADVLGHYVAGDSYSIAFIVGAAISLTGLWPLHGHLHANESTGRTKGTDS